MKKLFYNENEAYFLSCELESYFKMKNIYGSDMSHEVFCNCWRYDIVARKSGAFGRAIN